MAKYSHDTTVNAAQSDVTLAFGRLCFPRPMHSDLGRSARKDAVTSLISTGLGKTSMINTTKGRV